MTAPRFIGLSTGRSGSRYLASLLNDAGMTTLHESQSSLKHWSGVGAVGEISAWFVSQLDDLEQSTMVWHFSRHPQPFVSSLLKFGFWGRYVPSIHDNLRRTNDLKVDSFRYWVDWNRRLLEVPTTRRVTFRIEDVCVGLVALLASTIGAEVDLAAIQPEWKEQQEFAPIPPEVEAEVHEMMEELGYDA